MVSVPFLDIKAQNNALRAEIEQAVAPVVSEAEFILGPAVERFERDFAEFIGVGHCIGVNSGTTALHMALQACGVGPGDEVITTPHTWISTSWAISYAGARPVYVDIDPNTYNVDPDRVEHAITSRTKAIVPVHLYGHAAGVESLKHLAEAHDLVMIEDAAQAHGAIVSKKRAGSFGKAGCFSFYPSKNLGAFGEAGAVVTDDEELAKRIRRLRDHAQEVRHHHVELGFNSRMDGLQGAVLETKLRHLVDWNEARRKIAACYRRELDTLPGLELPCASSEESHVWHLFVVLVRDIERYALQGRLSDKKIGTDIHYPTPVPFQPAYGELRHRRGDFPVAEDAAGCCLSLPMFPELTEEQIEHTIDALKSLL